MILLSEKLSWFHRSTHGFFLAKKHFRGKYVREVFLTVYDPKLDKSCYGYLFICENNVILSILHDLTDNGGVYELDSSDILSIIEDDVSLSRIISSDKNGEKYAKVSTLNKICYVNLNDKYLLLINIQSDRIYYPTLVSGAYSIKYLTGKNYVNKVINLINLVNGTIRHENISLNLPIHGISPLVSKLILYSQLPIFILFLVSFLFYPIVHLFIKI